MAVVVTGAPCIGGFQSTVGGRDSYHARFDTDVRYACVEVNAVAVGWEMACGSFRSRGSQGL